MSTASQLKTLPDVLTGLKVIDCDTHFTEPPDLWVSRAPASYKDRVLQVKRVNGQDHWFIEGDIDFGPVGLTVVNNKGEKIQGKMGYGTFEELSRAAYDVKARLEFMDSLGLHAQIVYPNAAGFSATRFMSVDDLELRNLSVTTYNDAIAEWQRQSNGRLFPQALLPFWDLKLTLKEARRAKEDLGLTGLTITDSPESFDLPDYAEPYWDPFWELCSALEIPLDFHIGSGGMKGGPSIFLGSPWPSASPERRMAIGATMLYLDNARMLVNLLLSGILERFPKLKFVSVESGIGWIPFVLEAAEYQFDEMVPTERKNLNRRPTEYFRDHIYACFWFEDFGPRMMLEKVGVNNVLFETDFPHPTCLYPKAQEHIANVLQDLDPHVRRRVLQDNAIELYKLPIAVN